MNKYKKLLLTSVLAVSVLPLMSTASYADNCVASIKNTSNQWWVVAVNSIRGKVYFNGLSCTGTSCGIPPHTAGSLEYTYNTGITAGSMHIKDHTGEQHTFAYFSKSGACPRIEHASYKGGIKLNDPSAGDVEFVNDTWVPN